MEILRRATESAGTSKGESEAGFMASTRSASSNMVLSKVMSGWTVMNLSRAGARKKEKSSSDAEMRTFAAGSLEKTFPAAAQEFMMDDA